MRLLVDLVAKILVRALNGYAICLSNEYKKREESFFTHYSELLIYKDIVL